MCTIYLHSLGTNQFESLNLIPFLCTPELAVFSFDLPGCGISEGPSIPLDGSGCELVLAAVQHLRSHFSFTQFALWGRSLGAAIALHTVSTSNDFRCVVADSSFTSTRDFIYDQAKVNGVPKFFIQIAFPLVRAEVRRRTEMNIDYPFPINFVHFAHTPVLLGHGTRDTFIPPHHSEIIFAKYGDASKQLYTFEAKHNSPRPFHWYQTAARFIYRQTGLDEKVRMYNWVYSNSCLHVGNLRVVLENLRNSSQHDSDRPDVSPPRDVVPVAPDSESQPQARKIRRRTRRIGPDNMVVFPKGTFADVTSIIP
jgi:hypothetical protein